MLKTSNPIIVECTEAVKKQEAKDKDVLAFTYVLAKLEYYGYKIVKGTA